ncbi:mycothiol transferase [Mobilicoccus pelagius]|nr:DUF664 domain-containing protein [Mobilicoccus pelagius]
MNIRELLTDAASRPASAAEPVLDGLSDEAAHRMPADRGNTIAWLLWHAARQMDVQTVALSGGKSVWTSGGWAQRLGVDRGEDEFGFGDSPEDVAALHVDDVAALGAHLQACTDALTAYIGTLSEDDLGEVIDDSYDPPVTRGARIVSIIDDAAVHVGQAAYARGLVDGWRAAV